MRTGEERVTNAGKSNKRIPSQGQKTLPGRAQKCLPSQAHKKVPGQQLRVPSQTQSRVASQPSVSSLTHSRVPSQNQAPNMNPVSRPQLSPNANIATLGSRLYNNSRHDARAVKPNLNTSSGLIPNTVEPKFTPRNLDSYHKKRLSRTLIKADFGSSRVIEKELTRNQPRGVDGSKGLYLSKEQQLEFYFLHYRMLKYHQKKMQIELLRNFRRVYRDFPNVSTKGLVIKQCTTKLNQLLRTQKSQCRLYRQIFMNENRARQSSSRVPSARAPSILSDSSSDLSPSDNLDNTVADFIMNSVVDFEQCLSPDLSPATATTAASPITAMNLNQTGAQFNTGAQNVYMGVLPLSGESRSSSAQIRNTHVNMMFSL